MDKNKFIDEILAEWAMRSPDGLVGGHDTPENTAILNEILSERGELGINPLDLKFFEKIDNKLVAKPTHPLYNAGAEFELIRKGLAVPKTKTSSKNAKGRTDKKSKWTTEYLVKEKDFFETSARIIIAALPLLGSSREEFLDNFDELSAEDAVNFLNTKTGDPEYEKFLKALDAARVSKGKNGEEGEASGSKAGRGEFILVLLIKGGKSAGSKSGDIILPDGSAVEVKEVNDKGETFRATKASFGGRFNRIPFIESLNELIAFCVGKEDHIEALMDLAIDAGIRNKNMPEKRDAKGNPIRLTYADVPDGDKLGKLTALKKFLNTADINNLNISTSYALAMLGAHIRELNKFEAAKKIMDPDKAEFDIGKQTTILKVDDIPDTDLSKIRNLGDKPQEINVTVSSIAQEKRKAELIIPAIKRLKIFANAPTSMKDVYTPLSIAEDMFEAMSIPPGHYTGGIVFYNSKNGKFTYEPDLTDLKNGQYYFQSYQQTGPTFTKQEPKKES